MCQMILNSQKLKIMILYRNPRERKTRLHDLSFTLCNIYSINIENMSNVGSSSVLHAGMFGVGNGFVGGMLAFIFGQAFYNLFIRGRQPIKHVVVDGMPRLPQFPHARSSWVPELPRKQGIAIVRGLFRRIDFLWCLNGAAY